MRKLANEKMRKLANEENEENEENAMFWGFCCE